MKRSFLRLVVTSVLVCWAIGVVSAGVYTRNASWARDRARGDGVFLAFDLLNQESPRLRPERMRELQPSFSVDLNLVSVHEVERQVGRRLDAGDRVPWRESVHAEWYFMAFDDEGALAVGPVHPVIPRGVRPIGAILAIILVPLLAGFIALRVQRELAKVERASEALATGELGARVDNRHGPSNELAAKFNAMAERVERLIRSRDELVQAVSHELGSPLSRLRFHLALLEDPSETEWEERVTAMTRELDALDELVAELLGYVQSDELKIERTSFDPGQGLGDLAELATLEAPEDQATDVELLIAEDVEIFADQRLFMRAIENLLRNAVRYGEALVRVEVTVEEGSTRVAVHDDGPGIPEDQREKVTSPFVRLEEDRGRRTGGVGLGLAIVRRIMERHGGRLEIGVSPLGGAMVSTVWPLSYSGG